jgi:hypothetical protein
VTIGRQGSEGLGTTVRAVAPGGGDGAPSLATTWIGASTGYSSGEAPVAVLGLGPHTRVDLIIDRGEGREQRFPRIRVDRSIALAGGRQRIEAAC